LLSSIERQKEEVDQHFVSALTGNAAFPHLVFESHDIPPQAFFPNNRVRCNISINCRRLVRSVREQGLLHDLQGMEVIRKL